MLGAQAGRRAAAGGSGRHVGELAGGRLLARRREATAGQRREGHGMDASGCSLPPFIAVQNGNAMTILGAHAAAQLRAA